MKIEFHGVKTPLINAADKNIVDIILEALNSNEIKLLDKDIIIIASKVVSIIERCQISFDNIPHIRQEAKETAEIAGLDPRFVEIIFQEADEVLGAVPGAVLTLRDNILQANAGVDQSNAGGEDFLIVLPRDPIKTAEKVRRDITRRTAKQIGVIIADSKTHPLRRGTSGFALAVSGFRPLIDDIGTLDLYGRPMHITTRAIADNLVCGAEILMGETDQRVPIVIARGCEEITFEEPEAIKESNDLMKISPQLCIYIGPLWHNRKSKMGQQGQK
ncbi:MAG: coenzyme F420-0:L-glutamate ligase [Candidatus Heimdallarchaeota archaeon]|nr:MAG: coenzyme F420-0:L-glutamate ligase [Candidatus Heimdallarchaeota archaeon]